MDIRYLDKKLAKVTVDFSTQRAIDSAFTFDAADINATSDTISITGHPYKTGDSVSTVLTAGTGVTSTGPAIATQYFIIYVDKNTIALATSLANAKAGTKFTSMVADGTDVYLQRDCFGLITTPLVIPSGAVITNVTLDILTTFKSWAGAWGAGGAEDAATMSIGIASATDAVAAIAIDSGTIWDASRAGSLVGTPILNTNAADGDTAIKLAALTSAKFVKLTSDDALNFTIAVDSISQGKMDIYVEYFI